MPIEVRELVIKGTVKSQSSGSTGGSSQSSATIIQDCVDQVMSKLKDKKER